MEERCRVSPLQQQRYRQTALLLGRIQPLERANTAPMVQPDSWKREVDKYYNRPNIKLRKAHMKLAKSLKNYTLPVSETYSEIAFIQQKCSLRINVSRAAEKGDTSRIDVSSFQCPENSRENKSQGLLMNKSTTNRIPGPGGEKGVSNFSRTGQLTRLNKNDSNNNLQPSWTRRPGSAKDGKTEVPGQVKNQLSAVQLLEKTADDDLDGVSSQTETKRFCRPCSVKKTETRTVKPDANGVIPIQSCVEKAYNVAEKDTVLLNTSKVHLMSDEIGVQTKTRPQSAPSGVSTERFQFLNSKLKEHVNNIIQTRGKLNLIYPKDRNAIFEILKSKKKHLDRVINIENVYHNSLDKRLNCNLAL